jgi:hypothetical protein
MESTSRLDKECPGKHLLFTIPEEGKRYTRQDSEAALRERNCYDIY